MNNPSSKRESVRLAVLLLCAALLLAACSRDESLPPPMPPTIGEQALAALQVTAATRLSEDLARWQQLHQNAAAPVLQAEAAFQFGRSAMAYEQYHWASEAFQQACIWMQNDHRCWYLLAQSERAQGHYDQVPSSLRTALKIQPDYLPTRLQLAEALLEQGTLDEALEVLDSVATEDGAAELGLRGRIALAAGNAQAAVDLLRLALQRDPGASRLRYPLGLALRATGREEEAVSELAQRGPGAAVVDDPLMAEVKAMAGGIDVLKSRAQDLALAGDFARAAQLYTELLEVENDPLARVNLAIALSRSGNPQAAEVEYRTALAGDPDQVAAWFGLGSLLASLDRDAEAVEAYEQALRLHPGELDARFNLANALYRLGRMSQAERHYSELIARDPARADARLALAHTQLALARWPQVLATLREALETHPGDARIARELARLLASAPQAEVRDGASALRLAQHLFQRDSSLPNAEILAMALAENGRFDEASRLQQGLIRTAIAQQREDLLPGLNLPLAAYEAKRAWRMPEEGQFEAQDSAETER